MINTNLVVFNLSTPSSCNSIQLMIWWTLELCTKPLRLCSDIKPAEGLTLLNASKCESGKVRRSEKLNWYDVMLRMKKMKTEIEKTAAYLWTISALKSVTSLTSSIHGKSPLCCSFCEIGIKSKHTARESVAGQSIVYLPWKLSYQLKCQQQLFSLTQFRVSRDLKSRKSGSLLSLKSLSVLNFNVVLSPCFKGWQLRLPRICYSTEVIILLPPLNRRAWIAYVSN